MSAIHFRVTLPEHEASYIQHARSETLRAIDGRPGTFGVDPVPQAVYTVAYDTERDRRCGLTECAFQHDLAAGYEELPCASGMAAELDQLCPFPLMAGIRTMFVEPEYRVQRSLFLHLSLASAYVFRTLGARYTLATTNAADARLGALYEKLGGMRLGTCPAGGQQLALFVFSLDELVSHRAMDRVRANLEVDFHVLHTIRRRGLDAGCGSLKDRVRKAKETAERGRGDDRDLMTG